MSLKEKDEKQKKPLQRAQLRSGGATEQAALCKAISKPAKTERTKR